MSTYAPDPENRSIMMRSDDGGETWEPCTSSVASDIVLDEVRRLVALIEQADADEVSGGPLGDPIDRYGKFACGCTWDSGPYPVHCDAHDPLDRLKRLLGDG